MYMDLILESENGYGYDGVSAETMEEIDNIQVPSFTESALSPYDLVSKALYEFAEENVNVSKIITKAEMNYIKENGSEPLWEASDSKNIFQKFIDMIKSLIGKITGTFDKMMKSIETKVREVYNKYADKLEKKINTTNAPGLHEKKFEMRKYNPEVGVKILEKDPMTTLNSVEGYKVVSRILDQDDNDWAKSNFKDYTKGLIPKINQAIFGGTVSGVDHADYSSLSSIRSALHKAMVSEVIRADWSQAQDEIEYFRRDPKASSLKSDLKKRYNEIKSDLGKVIDDAKKKAKKAEKGTGKSSITGLYINILNKYVQAMTMSYNETCKVYNAKWGQSIRLYLSISSFISKDSKSYEKKQNKGLSKDEKFVNSKMESYDFGLSFE